MLTDTNMKESNFDFLDMKQSILDLLVSRSSLFNDVAGSQPALDVTPGPAQPVAVEVCLKIKIQTNLDVYRQLGSFSYSTQHVYFSTLIV